MTPAERKRLWGLLIAAALIVAIGVPVAHKIKEHAPPARPTARERAQNQCATAAFGDYNKATLALFQAQGTAPLPSVEQIVAKRRLQEQYCLEFAKCMLTASGNPQLVAIEYSTLFDSCLRDEALEEYDAVTRSDNGD
jgi:hypothetical protein